MTKNPIVTPQDAWRILAESIVPLPAGNVPLERAAGGWLTAPLAPRSAMDGFALRAADVTAPGTLLTVVGEVAAGSDLDPPLPPGACVRIFTGANVPRAADAVVPVEATTSKSFRTNPTDPEVGINTSCRPGDHIFGQGETARQGEILLPAGTRLGPRQLAVAAATGQTDVPIHDRPRVVVLNTGEELLEAGRPAGAHHTRNSNGPFLVAAVAAAGFTEVRRATVPDAADRTAAAFADALAAADAVILTGGISAGRHDYVPGALAAAGVEIAFRGVAIKPGKPQLFGRGPGGNVVFGLPGNPLSSLVGFYEFVLPALRRLAGCPLDRCRPRLQVPLACEWSHHGDRALVLPARLDDSGGRTMALPCPAVGSADLATGGRVDGAVLMPPRCGTLAAGTVVPFRPWWEGTSC